MGFLWQLGRNTNQNLYLVLNPKRTPMFKGLACAIVLIGDRMNIKFGRESMASVPIVMLDPIQDGFLFNFTPPQMGSHAGFG